MKVLWITNIELPVIAERFNRSVFAGGWMHQSSILLSKEKEIELHISSMNSESYEEVYIDNILYSAFEDNGDKNKTKNQLNRLLSKINPDIIHIWGTEYYHSLAALEILKDLGKADRTVVSIQGLVYYYSNYHYNAFLPDAVVKGYTFRDFCKRDNINTRKNQMIEAGENELRAISMAKNCIGRTDWDHACVKLINNDIHYYYCNEILRGSFYKAEWRYEDCNKHSVFFSQATYPIKGFHLALEAFAIVKKRYPDLRIRVLGKDLKESFDSYIRDDTYQRYLRKLIRKNDLSENITWLGMLSEKEMVKEYCSASVFVCSSSIENSSNSICEAMLLGVPVIASDVGGIKSMMEHQKEGIIYQPDAPYMLAYHIMELFENKDYSISLGENARKRALNDHDPEKNIEKLMTIYRKIDASAD